MARRRASRAAEDTAAYAGGDGVLVDSCVLIDLITADPAWAAWSEARLGSVIARRVAVINPIIYAEVAAGFNTVDELDQALAPGEFRREPLPWKAAFLASQAFQTYRRRGGERRSPLPDFYIGAHALSAGYPLLTRDGARYRDYFPGLALITPEGDPAP